MCVKLKKLMPVGSRWTVLRHGDPGGSRTVKAHQRKNLVFVNHARRDEDSFLGWPRDEEVEEQDGGKLVKIGFGAVSLTYVREGA